MRWLLRRLLHGRGGRHAPGAPTRAVAPAPAPAPAPAVVPAPRVQLTFRDGSAAELAPEQAAALAAVARRLTHGDQPVKD